MRVCIALAMVLCAGTVYAQMPIPAFQTTSTANATRGFYFRAPVDFLITGLRVPDESRHGLQNVYVTVRSASIPTMPAMGGGSRVFYRTGIPSQQIIPANIPVQAGQWVGVLGACGSATTPMYNSFGANGPFNSNILGVPVLIDCFITQSHLVLSGGNLSYATNPGFNISRVEVYVAPAQGLYTNFAATPTSGASPLAVQFTDTSLTSAPGGVTTWAWDFQSDGIVDSTVQNPQHTYGTCGYFDVTLTTSDSVNSPSTLRKPSFIAVDPPRLVDADFSVSQTAGPAPLVVQFSDTSTGSPTSWEWDLDGDTIVDSTLQNPIFSYAQGGFHSVSLTASNACGSNTEEKRDYINVLTNDECSGAIPLQFGGNGPFDTTAATLSAPAWSCGGGGAPDLWFSFTPQCRVSVLIDTCGSRYDTAMELFSGSCAGLNFIACSDDVCSTQSKIALNQASAGTTYYIRVGGYSGYTGTFNVNLLAAGNGRFSHAATGCGQALLVPSGSPNLGGAIQYTMTGHRGTPLMWIGTIRTNLQMCPAGCMLGTTFDILLPTSSIGSPVPCMPYLRNAVFYIQGADIGAPGGCVPPAMPIPITFTDMIVTRIG